VSEPAAEAAGAQRPVRVLVVAGSRRVPSFTRALCDAAAEALAAAGAEVDRWDVGDPVLPLADPAYHRDPRLHPDADVVRLVTAADAADAFVLGTPVYHGSMSGVLKNLLDHLAIAQFVYKPASLVGHGGRVRNPQALEPLRLSLQSVLAVSLPTQVVTAMGDFDDEGRVAAPEILARLGRLAHELVVFTESTRPARDRLVARYA
jgi:azobenzene reductase